MATAVWNHSGDTTIVAASYQGMTGWFKAPDGWYFRNTAGQWWGSPNATFIPIYALKTNEVGEFVFQDTLRSNS